LKIEYLRSAFGASI